MHLTTAQIDTLRDLVADHGANVDSVSIHDYSGAATLRTDGRETTSHIVEQDGTVSYWRDR